MRVGVFGLSIFDSQSKDVFSGHKAYPHQLSLFRGRNGRVFVRKLLVEGTGPMSYLAHVTSRTGDTPQSEPILGTNQVKNSAGGYAFPVDDWTRLDRFLILGSSGPTYYTSEKALTAENASAVMRCIKTDGPRTVRRIVEISDAGRAPKNDPALFALAMAAGKGNDGTRKAALAALPKVARYGTALLHFCAYVDQFRGYGRGLRSALGEWYTARSAADVAFQAVKYQSRDKWAQRDVLRLAHPKPPTEQHKTVFHWITQGWPAVGDEPHPDPALRLIWAFEQAKRTTDPTRVVELIKDYHLPREAVPTECLTSPAVWDALLAEMPMTAMVRNLATMTKVGLIAPLSEASKTVCARLGDTERLKKARVHPISLLAALLVYKQGHGERGTSEWKPVPQVVDALDAAFYDAFQYVPSTGKRYVLGLDISGSMDGGVIAGIPGLTPRLGAAAMAMVIARTEPAYACIGFTADPKAIGGGMAAYGGQYGNIYVRSGNDVMVDPDRGVTPLAISPRQRLDDVITTMKALPMGGTDCALPMIWAMKHKVQADAFIVITDNETWANPQLHPIQALQKYREAMGIPAKLIVLAMTSSGFTIADPADGGMLDCAGFDTAVPRLIADFVSDGTVAVLGGPE